jgi:hypothetical protein
MEDKIRWLARRIKVDLHTARVLCNECWKIVEPVDGIAKQLLWQRGSDVQESGQIEGSCNDGSGSYGGLGNESFKTRGRGTRGCTSRLRELGLTLTKRVETGRLFE